MDFWKNVRLFTFVLVVFISTRDPSRYNNTTTPILGPFTPRSGREFDFIITGQFMLSSDLLYSDESGGRLDYDFYRDSCLAAERIVREMIQEIYRFRPGLLPPLLRLAFHDCFIQGCDASILLDPTDGMASEKDSAPNQLLNAYGTIDAIKSEMERVCPGTVSCADIVVLAAREAVLTAGGPFYPLPTGRRDSMMAYAELAEQQLPSPFDDLSDFISAFATRGFDERETVALLGGHSFGSFHCRFFEERLYNFSGTNRPDPSMEMGFLNLMRSRCNSFHSASTPEGSVAASPYGAVTAVTSPAPSTAEPETAVNYEEMGVGPAEGPVFGAPYYRSLLQGRGILFADQQLMGLEETGSWVRAYAWDNALFRKDFAEAMLKLSSLQVFTAANNTQVRLNCSKVT